VTIGSPHLHERVTSSTNERARGLALAGAPHGTLVTAEEQTAGRGRQGRRWLARRGDALLMSLVVRGDARDTALLPLRAPVAVCAACEALGVSACTIKWPNDVWIARRKVAGILIEGRPREGWAVVGIGLNVRARTFDDEIATSATSLALATGSAPELATVRTELLGALELWLAADASAAIDAWRERDALAGEEVRWDTGSGTAAGISDDGALLVDLDGGERIALDAGEVHLVTGAQPRFTR
jgi:BirA family transcriptional regulator, biotin operon repressor / biotin---[acetyl-CoA-carboxylase] ligase